jgi:hypothetical protein
MKTKPLILLLLAILSVGATRPQLRLTKDDFMAIYRLVGREMEGNWRPVSIEPGDTEDTAMVRLRESLRRQDAIPRERILTLKKTTKGWRIESRKEEVGAARPQSRRTKDDFIEILPVAGKEMGNWRLVSIEPGEREGTAIVRLRESVPWEAAIPRERILILKKTTKGWRTEPRKNLTPDPMPANHLTERGRATAVANLNTTDRPRRSVPTFGGAMSTITGTNGSLAKWMDPSTTHRSPGSLRTFSPAHRIYVPSSLPTRSELKWEMFYEVAEQARSRATPVEPVFSIRTPSARRG